MFGRSNRLDRDVVAAAQRRLAALTDQHREGPAAPSPPEDGAAPSTQRHAAAVAPPVVQPPIARHVRSTRTEVGRWSVDAPQVTVAALLVVALVVVVAWWVLRSTPHAEPVQLSNERSVPRTGPVSGLSASTPVPSGVAGGVATGPNPTTVSSRLVVDVAGKVRDPGIVELPAGSRVVDAITAAGGARPGVSLTSLNLARLLIDGEQIVVGVDVPFVNGANLGSMGSGGGGASPPATVAIAPVNLNTATPEQLDTLPGVGPVTAQAILQWRADNGSFASVDDLLDVSGIGPATLAKVRPYAYV